MSDQGQGDAAGGGQGAGASGTESILSRLTRALDSAVSLEVTTVVADFSVEIEEGKPFKVSSSGQVTKGIHTRIDLIQGDMGTIVANDAYDPNKPSPLQALHAEQVANAQKIVQANLQMVGQLAQWLGNSVMDALKEERPAK